MTDRRLPAVRSALAFGLAAAVLAIAGCVPSGPTPIEDPPPGTIEAFYAQPVDWTDCDDGLECATVTAPLDWDHPDDGRTIDLAVIRHPATGDRIGALLMNPGGPGVSGVDDLREHWRTTFGEALVERFDLVSWDPRGAGQTTPVVCYTDPAEVEEWLYGVREPSWRVDRDGWAQAMADADREYVAACAEGTGEALEFVDTESTVRDLDLLRAVLGDERLHYLGFSYGTLLGQRYLDRFPEHVGRMVLDGVVDPEADGFQQTLGQHVGFERAFASFVEQCPERFGGDCPLPANRATALAEVQELIARVDEHPIAATDPGDDRRLSAATLTTAIIHALYSERTWPELAQMLRELRASPPATTAAFSLVQEYDDFLPGVGLGSNDADARVAINCADTEVERDPAVLEAQADMLAAAAPTMRVPTPGIVDSICGNWPYPVRPGPAGPITGKGLAPILVVSTTGDAATPYDLGVRVAERLESGVLVTNHEHRHTAYRRAASACLRDVVENYLIEETVPGQDPHCGR